MLCQHSLFSSRWVFKIPNAEALVKPYTTAGQNLSESPYLLSLIVFPPCLVGLALWERGERRFLPSAHPRFPYSRRYKKSRGQSESKPCAFVDMWGNIATGEHKITPQKVLAPFQNGKGNLTFRIKLNKKPFHRIQYQKIPFLPPLRVSITDKHTLSLTHRKRRKD